MGYLIIPLEEDPQEEGTWIQNVSLEGVDYQLGFGFNDREGFWYMDLLDTEDNPIVYGIKLVSNVPLLRSLRVAPRPPGELMIVDTRTPARDPGFDDLGVNVFLGYIESDSL
jgi:hypothetical protein